jgi:hypothetical protein
MKTQLARYGMALVGMVLSSGLGVWFVKRFMISQMVGEFSRLLVRGLRAQGIADKHIAQFYQDLTTAFIRLAEAEIPVSGFGTERFTHVCQRIQHFVPWFSEEQVEELVQAAFDQEQAALTKVQAEAALTGPAPGPAAGKP